MAAKTLKQQIHEAVETLPVQSLSELAYFVDYLQFKASQGESEKLEVIQLGGLWKDISFDLTEGDIREVRRELTHRLEQRAKRVS
jgi:hypothetical protein